MKAVIIDARGEIAGLLREEGSGNEVVVAGAVTVDGAPVNMTAMKVSRSASKLDRARRSDAQFATKREYRGAAFYVL